MKNFQILNLVETLSQLDLPGAKFAYGVSRNIHILKPHVQALQEARKASPDFMQYDKERAGLAKKYSKKDEKGKPVIVGTEYVLEDRESFDKDFAELQQKYSEAIQKREQQMREFAELADKDVEVELYKIKLADVPQEITTAQMNDIYELIEE